MANILKGYPNIFFTADWHIGHEFMLRGIPGQRVPRPMFTSVEEMDETIIERHNSVVKSGDLVYNLGDIFVKCSKEYARGVMRRLHGNQYFVMGNHDAVAEAIEDEFVWIKDLVRIHPKAVEGIQPIILCHYAMKVWHGSHKGTWHLYGHSHGMLPEDHVLSFDVGVDCWNFYPVSIEEVKAKMAKKMPAWEAYRASLVGSGRAE